MTLKVRKSMLMQYILIYIMILTPGSCLFAIYWKSDVKYITLLLLYIILFFSNKKYRCKYSILFVLFLLLVTLFTRLLNGGAGISSWIELAICILSTQFAICCDKNKFLSRWIKVVCFFASISIIFWLIFCIAPNLLNNWPAATYFTQAIGSKGYETYWHGKGLIFYSYLEIHPKRNCGIFTEPGVYQIVLNSTLFVLLFWRDKLCITSFRKYRRCVAMILVALVTCQSTTGYIGMLLILLFFYFIKVDISVYSSKIKRFVLVMIVIGLIFIFTDYLNNGEQSILYLQVINKLFSDNSGGIDLSNSSGIYRLGTILVSISVIIKHPLGIGYDAFQSVKNEFGTGLVAASFVSFAAIYGIIPWIITLGYVFKPALYKEKLSLAILFIALFINTTLAQTHLLYPALLMMPLYLVVEPKSNKYIC